MATEQKKALMAFWPLGMGQGEPNELQFRAGRIDFCVGKIKSDSAYLKLFGSAAAAGEALCQYEFCLELNSFMAFPGEGTNESAAYLEKMFPETTFYFWPSLIAFPLEYVFGIASSLFVEIRERKTKLLRMILFDDAPVGFLTGPGDVTFLRFLDGLAREQVSLFMEQRRFPPMLFWPREIGPALKQFRQKGKPTTA